MNVKFNYEIVPTIIGEKQVYSVYMVKNDNSYKRWVGESSTLEGAEQVVTKNNKLNELCSRDIADLLKISINEVYGMVSRGDKRFPKFPKRKPVRIDANFRIEIYYWDKQQVLDWIEKNG